MKKICLMLCIIVIVFAFSACQNNTSSENNTNGLGQIESKEQLDELYGVWELDKQTKYSFDGKGAGELILSSDNYSFSYKIKDGVLSIDFSTSIAKDSKYKYSITDDVLVLDSQDDNKGKYELKKQIDNKPT